jgi:hypothetical protein
MALMPAGLKLRFNGSRRATLGINTRKRGSFSTRHSFQSAPKGQSADRGGDVFYGHVFVCFNRPRRASLRIRSFVHAIRFFRGNSSLTSGLHWTWKIVSVIDIRTLP